MVGATFSCPRCGRSLDVSKRELAGKQFDCPQCGQRIVVKKSQPAAPVKNLAMPPRRRRRANALLVPGSVAAGVLIVGILFAWDRMNRPNAAANVAAGSTASSESPRQQSIALQHAQDVTPILADQSQSSRVAVQKKDRQPIPLQLVPAGARILVHLRPSALWQSGSRGEEIRKCLPELAAWAERQITAACLFAPGEIEEVLFAFGLREPGEPLSVSATIWLKEPVKESELSRRFAGQRREKAKLPTFVTDNRALVVLNAKTFAVGPLPAAEEMAEASDEPNPTDESIEELHGDTDRSREMTLVFRPDDLDRFRESLAPESFLEIVHKLALWLNPEATEGAIVSLRLADPFRVRVALRNRPLISEQRLQSDFQKRFEKLPAEILGRVKMLKPQTTGHQKLIGRVPAMWKAVSLGLVSWTAPRLVTFESVLPERAAANLTLGSYLAMQSQNASPDVNGTPNVSSRDSPGEKPKSITERLKQQVDVDFRRTPLSEAFTSIGEDIGVPFEIDGGALKIAGYTKNMPQTFRLEKVPATKALATILKPYPKMALVIDDRVQQITVTTRDAALAKGKKPLELAP